MVISPHPRARPGNAGQEETMMTTHTIRTRYEGPTDTRGARVVARSEGKQATVAYDYRYMGHDQHERAVRALMARLGWSGALTAGEWQDSACTWTLVED
jgi:hypothetical protein